MWPTHFKTQTAQSFRLSVNWTRKEGKKRCLNQNGLITYLLHPPDQKERLENGTGVINPWPAGGGRREKRLYFQPLNSQLEWSLSLADPALIKRLSRLTEIERRSKDEVKMSTARNTPRRRSQIASRPLGVSPAAEIICELGFRRGHRTDSDILWTDRKSVQKLNHKNYIIFLSINLSLFMLVVVLRLFCTIQH